MNSIFCFYILGSYIIINQMIANITKKNAIVLFEEREREFNGI
jgi:hypothetical protein